MTSITQRPSEICWQGAVFRPTLVSCSSEKGEVELGLTFATAPEQAVFILNCCVVKWLQLWYIFSRIRNCCAVFWCLISPRIQLLINTYSDTFTQTQPLWENKQTKKTNTGLFSVHQQSTVYGLSRLKETTAIRTKRENTFFFISHSGEPIIRCRIASTQLRDIKDSPNAKINFYCYSNISIQEAWIMSRHQTDVINAAATDLASDNTIEHENKHNARTKSGNAGADWANGPGNPLK